MAGDTSFPRIWGEATIYVADVGTTAPDDVATPFDTDDWLDLGLLEPDAGIEVAFGASTTEHYAWGVGMFRRGRSKDKVNVKFTCLEANPGVFDLLNPGESATIDTGVATRSWVRWTTNPKAFAIELIDGDITKRLIIPKGEVVDPLEALKITEEDPEMFVISIEAYFASDGTWATEITDNPAALVT